METGEVLTSGGLFPTSYQEQLETVKQEHLGGPCLDFTNQLQNHLCWHLAPPVQSVAGEGPTNTSRRSLGARKGL